MIESINICNDASYAEAQPFAGLKKINYVFGANGSGKTTISRIIADPSLFPLAVVTWKDSRPTEALVYNSDFVERSFVPQMRGIFTLGEEDADKLAEIEAAREEVEKHLTAIGTIQDSLGIDESAGKRKEFADLRATFEKQCWAVKDRHDAHFKGAFEGLRSKKAAFCDRVLQEQARNQAALHEIDALKARAVSIYEGNLQRAEKLAVPAFTDLKSCETNEILAKKIVGKDDVDVAALIRRLGNSDWVKEGLGYLAASSEQCPFCQQAITSSLANELNEYFDETYMNDMAALSAMSELYRTATARVISQIDAILDGGNAHVNFESLTANRDLLNSRIEANLRLIERKQKEPSSVVTLEPTVDLTSAISETITAANALIEQHNNLVANHANEKAKLTDEIWKCLLEEEKATIDSYISAKSKIDKAIEGLERALSEKREAHWKAKKKLSDLEKGITSVQPTVNEINQTLESFGFTGFALKTAGEKDHLYEIVRPDGSSARSTLSEGEKSFISFLYFYNLLKGSHSESGMTAKRVVVFDDPVSSLDSDVLFIVSALIKRVLDDAVSGEGLIQQVFVLTHNIYFHKEVAFNGNRSGDRCMKHETFWIVRKDDNKSRLENYDHNPIKTSYELLWEDVRNPKRSRISIQNTMRRILENYFTILGNRKKDDIIEKFTGRDKMICAALYSWVNDGSHSAYDDVYVSLHDEQIDRYLSVFKRIFEETSQISHYNMMMRHEDGEEQATVDSSTTSDGANLATA